MFLNYIYDMDGTLIDGKQEIKNGVIEMFDCIIENTPNAKFTIASGSRLNQIQATVNKIKSSTKNQIEFNIIAHAGSLILYNNEIIKCALSEEENNIVLEIIKKYDKEAMVVYRGLNEDYHIQPKTKKEADFYDAVLEIGNRYGIYSNPLSANEIEKNIKNQDVLSVEIVSVNFQNEIYEELKREMKGKK